MLTGEKLGQAIAAAIKLKGVSKKTIADSFGVRPPSVQDWCKRGTISKDRLIQLWAYFSDVVGPEHWGLSAFPDDRISAGPLVEEAIPHYGQTTMWPFRQVSLDRVNALPEQVLQEVDETLDHLIRQHERKLEKLAKHRA